MDPRAAVALGRWIPARELRLTYTGGGDYAYWEAVIDLWDGTQDLMIVEQDIEISKFVRPVFSGCPEPWCTFWYAGPPLDDAKAARLDNCTGCVRFSRDAQRKTRKRLIDIGPVKWDMLDRVLIKSLAAEGMNWHVHGQVRHHHFYRVTWLPSPSLRWARYTWDHVDKNEYPNMQPRPEIPADAESFIIDCSKLDGE